MTGTIEEELRAAAALRPELLAALRPELRDLAEGRGGVYRLTAPRWGRSRCAVVEYEAVGPAWVSVDTHELCVWAHLACCAGRRSCSGAPLCAPDAIALVDVVTVVTVGGEA